MLGPNHRSVKSTHINRPADPENWPSIMAAFRWPPPRSTGIVMQSQAQNTSWPNHSIAFKQPLDTELILEELEETVPLSVSRHEDIKRLREMARGRFVNVN